MTDFKSGPNPLFLREEDLRQGIELLFHAYRDFEAAADAALSRLGLGRTHRKAIYFIGRHPGISISRLMAILKTPKQTMSRVLTLLTETGYVSQSLGARDRRQRLLQLTEKGQDLERQLFDIERKIMARAYRRAGGEAVEGFRTVLLGLIKDPPVFAAGPEDPGATRR